jgi:hypothetical protein
MRNASRHTMQPRHDIGLVSAGVLRSAARARDAGTLPAPPLPSAPPPVMRLLLSPALRTVVCRSQKLGAGKLHSFWTFADARTPASPRQVLDAAAVDALAVATSHPTWMVARWAPRFGPAATLALLQANNRCAWTPSGCGCTA